MPNLFPKYFIRTYEYAQWIRNAFIYEISDDDLLSFLQYNEPIELTEDVIKMFLKPQKYSYLHQFIDTALSLSFDYESRKFADPNDWNTMTSSILGLEINLDLFNSDTESGEEYKELIEDKIRNEVLPKITEEIFSILFCDKEFLFHFNLYFAERIKDIEDKTNNRLFNDKGYIHRVNYWPKWLEKGLFYRDKGRCSYCFKDISSLLNIENKLNIDHIIPLANGGTNDTSNCQILCETCNNEKREKVIKLKEYRYFKSY